MCFPYTLGGLPAPCAPACINVKSVPSCRYGSLLVRAKMTVGNRAAQWLFPHASHPSFGYRDARLKTAATPLGPKAATGIPARLSRP
jgi:hypothetical protein